MGYRTRVTRDPYELVAKFASVCPDSGKAIGKGDICIYYPSARKAYHVDSKTASDFRGWMQDRAMGFDY